MRRIYIIVVLSLVSILFSGCYSELGRLREDYDRIKILDDGKLHQAHGYVVHCSPDGEELVLKILSVCYPIPKYLYGNYMLPDWIKATSHSRNEESGFQSMEMLEINLTISPNNTDSVRKCDLMFTDCGAGNIDANAKVTISQPPK